MECQGKSVVESPDQRNTTERKEKKCQVTAQNARPCIQADHRLLIFLPLLRGGVSQPDHNHGNVVVRVSGFGIFDELFHRLFRTLDVSYMIDGLLVFRDIPQLGVKEQHASATPAPHLVGEGRTYPVTSQDNEFVLVI